jgi:multidrug efflux pump subunit AcrB
MNQKYIPGSSGLISLFTRHRNASNLVMALMIIFGIFSIGRINTQFFPTIEINTIRVVYNWTGASAEDIESNVLQIVEPEIRYMDGVEKITSVAREGAGVIVLEYEASYDMQKAQDDLEGIVKAITNLPEEVEIPKFNRDAFFDRIARLAITGDVPEAALRFYAKKIRDDLIGRGIDKVSFVGLRDIELQADIPESELRRLGLTISDISRSISSNSRDMPSGHVKGRVEKQLRALSDVQSVKSLGQIEVKSFSSGEKVKLRDIAKVQRSFDEDQPQGYSSCVRAI